MWRYWIAPCVWFVLDFIASTSLLSSAHTGQMLETLCRLLHVRVTNFDLLNHFLRKLGHFTAYAVLGGLLFRAWRATLPQRRAAPGAWAEPLWTPRWSGLAWLVALGMAALDEYHQSFVPSRGASVHDVALDAAGALLMQLVLMLLWIDRTRPASAKP